MTQGQTTIELGDRRFVVVPQKLPRLKKRLGAIIDGLGETNVQGSGALLDMIDSKGYEILEALTGGPPAMLSHEEWEHEDSAPTFPQVKKAITDAAAVNGLDAFKSLGNLIGVDMIRALLNQQMIRMIAGPSPKKSSTPSASESGDNTSTGGMTTDPTSPASTAATGSAESPSPEPPSSSDSETPPAGESSAGTP